MSEPAALLDIRDVAKAFGSVVALRAAALSVRPGEVHALMGANGAGKSTLVKIITGVFPANGGTMALGGAPVSFRSPAEARRAGIVSVYQDPALVPDLSVVQNLRLARVPVTAVLRWLAELGVDDLDLDAFIRDLPYPTLRLIDLARALASDPKILLLDEITAALPADLAERVFAMVRRWRERNHSVIFISHRMAEVSALCDRATVLRDGVTVGVTDTARGSEERIVSLMLGSEVAKASAGALHRAPQVPEAAGNEPPALEVKGLSCGHALRDVSFSLRAGEVLGVAALEGQGQEELFDCIAGVRRSDGGAIFARGRRLNLHHPADAIREGLVLVPANRLQALLQQRSIRENVALPRLRGIGAWGPIDMTAERRRVEDAVRRLQIDTRAESELRRLSGGNQQKVVIARWLASGFRTLLCFDPTRGIDIGTKRQIYALVRELAAGGSAVLLFTSELPEIALACDRAVVLFGGRIVREMPAAEADEETLLRAAHGLVPHAEVGA
jgi:ribose transport system ATP-binding protein